MRANKVWGHLLHVYQLKLNFAHIYEDSEVDFNKLVELTVEQYFTNGVELRFIDDNILHLLVTKDGNKQQYSVVVVKEYVDKLKNKFIVLYSENLSTTVIIEKIKKVFNDV